MQNNLAICESSSEITSSLFSSITGNRNDLWKSLTNKVKTCQLFNIFLSQMSIIGPRPALWNQTDLISERDKYNANDIKPGLTGWAQINGRDELDIVQKAKLDGEYVKNSSFRFDCKCFFLTIKSVICSDGVIDGDSTNNHSEYREEAASK